MIWLVFWKTKDERRTDDCGLRKTIKSRPFKKRDRLMSSLRGNGRRPVISEVNAVGYLSKEMMLLEGPRLLGQVYCREIRKEKRVGELERE